MATRTTTPVSVGTNMPNGVNVPEGKLYIDNVGVTASGAELNKLDGVTATTADLNKSSLLISADRVVKVAKVALAIASTNVLSWANPESSDIIITRLVVNVTTASTGASTIDFGTTATTATTSSDNLIDGVSGASIAALDNLQDAGTNGKQLQKLASGKWVTGTQASGDITGIVGFAYIHYFVV